MIFKIEFADKIEFAQAEGSLSLLQEYAKEYGWEAFLEMRKVTIIEPTQAKTIMLKNTDNSTYKECPVISLYDLQCGDDFVIIGSKELE